VKVLVCTVRRYNGHELWQGLATLLERGHTFEITSTAEVIMDELSGKANRVSRTWDEVALDEEFDGLMIVSGNPKDTANLWVDDKIRQLVEAYGAKPVAAICAAVPAIRYVASGKRVAFYPLIRSRQLLGDAGAVLTHLSVCVDQNLVTAESQARSVEWANYFCDLLEGIVPEFSLIDSGYRPLGKPYRRLKEIRNLIGEEDDD